MEYRSIGVLGTMVMLFPHHSITRLLRHSASGGWTPLHHSISP
jgi:hypothetical protein